MGRREKNNGRSNVEGGVRLGHVYAGLKGEEYE